MKGEIIRTKFNDISCVCSMASSISEYTNTLICVGGDDLLLPVCVIYGPNGGEKSNVLIALQTLREIILQPMLQMAFMKKKMRSWLMQQLKS